MSFGPYVAEEHDRWLKTVRLLADPLEEALAIDTLPDERKPVLQQLEAELAGRKYFVLVDAKRSIAFLIQKEPLQEAEIRDIHSVFDRLKESDELQLYQELRSLRPEARKPPPPTGAKAELISLAIAKRIEPLAATADRFYVLRNPERRRELIGKLRHTLKHTPWGIEKRYLLLREKGRIRSRWRRKVP